MKLFANEREANLESTVAMVEDVLIELGHFVNECRRERVESKRCWTIHKGSASIDIDLIYATSFFRLRASATVMTIDATVDRALLFERLLELNVDPIKGAAFGLQGSEVVLLAERSTIDLDRSELRDLINVVRFGADEFDDKLVDEFGGNIGKWR